LRREPPIRVPDTRVIGVSAMDHHTLAKAERLLRWNRKCTVLTAVAGELFDAERIRGE
jgi:hypothetical protein